MKRVIAFCCVLARAAAGAQGAARKAKGGKMELKVSSPAFAAGAYIPAKHACGGADVSPELRWEGAPAGTVSFAVIMDDPDAPPGTWVHWVLFNIPGAAKGLPEGVDKVEELSDGSRHGACWGVDEFSRTGYYGPCPPPGKPHRYFFKVYALDRRLDLKAGADKTALLKAMKGHILAAGEIMGLYRR
jgi:Raf kinase inhibitor-like YbhB/YbcL family protein